MCWEDYKKARNLRTRTTFVSAGPGIVKVQPDSTRTCIRFVGAGSAGSPTPIYTGETQINVAGVITDLVTSVEFQLTTHGQIVLGAWSIDPITLNTNGTIIETYLIEPGG